MTAGQIAAPHRQIGTPLLVGALIVAFGVGLVTGLVAPRTVGQSAPAAVTVSAVHQPSALVAAPAGAQAAAPVAALQGAGAPAIRGAQNFREARPAAIRFGGP